MRTRSKIWQMTGRVLCSIVSAISILFFLSRYALVEANGPVSYETYRQFVASAIEQVRSARSQPAKTCAATLERIATQLESITSVRMPDGTLMRVEPCCGIEEALRVAPCDTGRAESFLRGLCPGCTSVQLEVIVTGLPPGTLRQTPAAQQTVGPQQTIGPLQTVGLPQTAVPQPTAGAPQTVGAPSPDDMSPVETAANPETGDPGQPTDGSEETGDQGGPDNSDDSGPTPAGEDNTQPDSDSPESPSPENNQPGGQDVQDDAPQPAGEGDAGRQTATPETVEGDPTQPPAGETPSPSPGQTTSQPTPTPPAENEQTFTWRNALVWLLVVIGVLALAVGALLVWPRQESEQEPVQPKAIPEPEKAIDRAEQLIAAGDYRAAVRYLVLAVLAVLHKKGRLDFDRSLTNRELLHVARQDPALAEPLAAVVHTFDSVWYGFKPIAPSDYELLVAKIDALKQL